MQFRVNQIAETQIGIGSNGNALGAMLIPCGVIQTADKNLFAGYKVTCYPFFYIALPRRWFISVCQKSV